MFSLSILPILFIIQCAFSGPIDGQCKDDECWKEGIQKLFSEYYAGDAEKGIKSMDPIVLENINVPEEQLGLNANFPSLKITVLKNATITDYSKFAPNEVFFILKLDYVANGPVNIQFINKNKNLTGTIRHERGVDYHILYPQTLEDGKVIIGKEKVGRHFHHSQTTIDENLIRLLESDIDITGVNKNYYLIYKEHEDRVRHTIATAVFKVVLENIRTVLNTKL